MQIFNILVGFEFVYGKNYLNLQFQRRCYYLDKKIKSSPAQITKNIKRTRKY